MSQRPSTPSVWPRATAQWTIAVTAVVAVISSIALDSSLATLCAGLLLIGAAWHDARPANGAGTYPGPTLRRVLILLIALGLPSLVLIALLPN